MRTTPILILLTAIATTSCQDRTEEADARTRTGKAEDTVALSSGSSTRKMAALLAEVARKERMSGDPYFNNARADDLARKVQTASNPQEYALNTIYRIFELVNAGRTVEAISLLEPLMARVEEGKIRMPPQITLGLYHELAIAYMRLGEQVNCLEGHTAGSCIIPIGPDGRHHDQEGSRKAITVYTRILERIPDDLTARWLMNVAYMTLGEYPGGVPAQWLIPERAFGPLTGFPHFTDVAMRLGLDQMGLSGGGCMEDFNNDGLLDILCSSWSLRDQIHLFLANGDGSFTDATERSGLTGITGGLNMADADYDNDGLMDVLVLRGAWLTKSEQPVSLLHNLGNGRFEDVTEAAGLLRKYRTQTASWADYDNDGLLDVFVGNESVNGENYPSALFRNNGDGTFTDVSLDMGVRYIGYVKGAAFGDVDNDGDQDLYISDLGGPNHLFLNQGAGGGHRFQEAPQAAGADGPRESFPTWFFDADNDGWLDLFVSAYPLREDATFAAATCASYLGLPFPQETTPRLYLNNGDGTFRDATVGSGLDLPLFTMGCNFGDIDNDGRPDIFLGTGEPDLRSAIPNRMFRGLGNGRFEEVTTAGGFGNIQKGHAISFGDIDNDGDQDIYVVLGGAYEGDTYHNQLYENPGMGNHWTTLFLVGVRCARSAVGARIRVTVAADGGERDIHVRVGTGGSFGCSSIRQEIGLGNADRIMRIEVTWPTTGIVQTWIDVPMDAPLRLTEGDDQFEELVLPVLELKAAAAMTTDHRHTMHPHRMAQ